jgi:PKD repeat protein
MDGVNFIDDPTVSHEFSGVGFYDIFLEITNEYGCVTSITANDYIEMVDVPYPNFFINPNPTTIFNTLVTMNPNLESDEYDYFWDMPGAIPATSEEMNPTVFYPEGIAGTYQVTLTVTDEYGCTNNVIRYLEVIPDIIIYAPNMFTPDGDNVNNAWRIYMDGIAPTAKN